MIYVTVKFSADVLTSYTEACFRLSCDTNLELSTELVPIIDTHLLP